MQTKENIQSEIEMLTRAMGSQNGARRNATAALIREKQKALADCATRNAAESELTKSQPNAARETVQLTYDERAIEYMKPDLARLVAKLRNCRIDMHEPDEQEIAVVVTGTHLDNAMGDDPNNNRCEFTVGLGDTDGNDREWFNLATLIALARLAKL